MTEYMIMIAAVLVLGGFGMAMLHYIFGYPWWAMLAGGAVILTSIVTGGLVWWNRGIVVKEVEDE